MRLWQCSAPAAPATLLHHWSVLHLPHRSSRTRSSSSNFRFGHQLSGSQAAVTTPLKGLNSDTPSRSIVQNYPKGSRESAKSKATVETGSNWNRNGNSCKLTGAAAIRVKLSRPMQAHDLQLCPTVAPWGSLTFTVKGCSKSSLGCHGKSAKSPTDVWCSVKLFDLVSASQTLSKSLQRFITDRIRQEAKCSVARWSHKSYSSGPRSELHPCADSFARGRPNGKQQKLSLAELRSRRCQNR